MNIDLEEFLHEDWFDHGPEDSAELFVLWELYSAAREAEKRDHMSAEEFREAVERGDCGLRRDGDDVFGVRLNKRGERMPILGLLRNRPDLLQELEDESTPS